MPKSPETRKALAVCSLQPELQTLYDEHIAELHDQLQADTHSDVENKILYTQKGSVGAVSYYQVEPPQGSDSDSSAWVSPFPYAIDLNVPMYMRSEAVAGAADMPMPNIVFPNLAQGNNAVRLDTRALKSVWGGNTSLISDGQLRALELAGVTDVHLFNYSQGVRIGNSLAQLLAAKRIHDSGAADVKTIINIEAPNTEERSMPQLIKDMTKSGQPGLRAAINASSLPAQIEAAASGDGLRARLREGRQGLGYLRDAVRPTNIAIGHTMGQPSYDGQLNDLLTKLPQTIVWDIRMQDSDMHKAETHAATAKRFADHQNFKSLEVAGYGHEAGDHVILMAMLARMASKTVVTTG